MALRTTTELGRALRDRRRKAGLRQGELAARVGVSRQWIGALESGKATVELGLALRTIAALGLELQLAPMGRRSPVARPSASAADLDAVIARARGSRR